MPRIYDERKNDGEFILLGTSATIPNRHDIGAVFGEVPFVGSLAYDETTKTMELYHTNVSHFYAWETVCAKSGLIVDKGVNQFDMTGTDFVSDGPVLITGTLRLSLGETGVAQGTYEIPTLTVDANGRVTSITPYSAVVPPHVASLDMTASGVGITLDGTNAWNLTLNPLPGGGPFTNAVITVNGEGFVTDIHSGTPIPEVENFTTVALSSSTLSLPTPATITGNGAIDIELDTKITLPSGHETEDVPFPTLTVDQYGFIDSIASDIPSYFLTPEMFGAMGNGTHDDFVALNNMFSWASGDYTQTPSLVGMIPKTDCMKLTPGKTYLVGSNYLMPISGRLYGANKTSITGSGGWMLNNMSSSLNPKNLYFENITFDGEVCFSRSDNLILSNCIFTSNFLCDNINNLTMDNCVVNLTMPNTANIENCNNVLIENSFINLPNNTSFFGEPWYIIGFTTCSSLTFKNNSVETDMNVLSELNLNSITSIDISNNLLQGTVNNIINCSVDISNSSINISNNCMNGTYSTAAAPGYTLCPMNFTYPSVKLTNTSLKIVGNLIGNPGNSLTTYATMSYCQSFLMAWNRPIVLHQFTVLVAPSSTSYEVF